MIDCFVFDTPISYPDAVEMMEKRVQAVRNGTENEALWFLEHQDVYTAGIHADPSELKNARFPVFQTNRGGKYTWHGKGQRVIYAILDLNKAHLSPKRFVELLQLAAINALSDYGVKARTVPDRIGLWVTDENGTEKKIAALGLRIRHGISFHGISVNIMPDLNAFDGIIPCGLADFGVTSMKASGANVTGVNMLDHAFATYFGNLIKAPVRFVTSL